ncbi:catalytic domain thiamin pyrophosphokinase, putative [Rhizoctonia solani AG-3 Rhs1AP]|uniref:Catalytic domain thiamin pyrophosphokinase, putative n=1 Tax=Rhizoctonia solani AG-3 Rhs1AP TaxID=1086054 RepID=X8J8J5_9AGAM|nr:catalytic domain thiamin pyrophosphokinase, putative [Rhizoctonia solani AG-3 Rhs1AP]
MRFSLPSEKRYTGPHYDEVDKRANAELIHEIELRLVPRAGGGGRGGGGGGGRGGSGGSGGGGSGGGSRGGVSFSGSNGNRGASSYGAGGGSVTSISSGAFIGRPIGGGARPQVYGNSRYGSGYTYGGGSSVAGRGFPFGYWPVFVPIGAGAGYYGYREYGPANNDSRPGGQMQQALIRSSDWPADGGGGNTTTNNATASYYIVGDADSVSAVMDALVAQCSVVNATGTAVNDNNSTVHVEQAVQYYRASSFMLALTSYNNSANLPSNAPADNNTAAPPPSADTPLPAGTNTTFLNCLNETIGESVPIMDAAPGALRATTGLNVVGMLWLMIWLLKIF